MYRFRDIPLIKLPSKMTSNQCLTLYRYTKDQCGVQHNEWQRRKKCMYFWIMHPSTYLNSALSKRDKFGSAFLKFFILLLQPNFGIPLHLIFFSKNRWFFLPFMMQIIFQLIPWKAIFFNVISTLCATKTQQPRASSSYISRPRNFEKKVDFNKEELVAGQSLKMWCKVWKRLLL